MFLSQKAFTLMSKALKGNQYGFTLIELLVVIAIIAIISTIAMVTYSGLQKGARDAIRKSDINALATALEINKIDVGYLPLHPSQFAKMSLLDPSGNVYCIATGTPDDPVVTDTWADTCPSGFVSVAEGAPAPSFTAWKACTYLENSAQTGQNVFCRSNVQ